MSSAAEFFIGFSLLVVLAGGLVAIFFGPIMRDTIAKIIDNMKGGNKE